VYLGLSKFDRLARRARDCFAAFAMTTLAVIAETPGRPPYGRSGGMQQSRQWVIDGHKEE